MSDAEGKEKEISDKESAKGDDKDRPVSVIFLLTLLSEHRNIL